MNLVDLTLVIFVALTVFVGIKRGFLISLLSALRFIIAVPLSLFVGNNYNVIIYNKVLIVDDIYTTGTTIDACAECLKMAGVKEVYAVTLCVGRGF